MAGVQTGPYQVMKKGLIVTHNPFFMTYLLYLVRTHIYYQLG
jgi:hypothetical protein